MREYIIYYLVYADKYLPFYVGITCNYKERKRQHFKKFGDNIKMKPVYSCVVIKRLFGTSEYIRKIESALINIIIDNGFDLINKFKAKIYDKRHYRIACKIYKTTITKN